MDVSGVTSWIMKMAINPLMWLLIIIAVFGGMLIILKLRKNKRMVYPVAEIVDLGSGKTNINTDMQAGYFGKKQYLKGLWWTGEEILRTSLGDIVEYFSTEDFQEINGKRGIICYRDPVRHNVLFPISNLNVKNKELIAAVAPADFTDVAVDIVKDSIAETTDWRDKLIQFGAWALVVVFSLIAIIVIVQMVKNGQDKSAELMLNAGKQGAEACRSVCSDALNVVLSKGGSAATAIATGAP